MIADLRDRLRRQSVAHWIFTAAALVLLALVLGHKDEVRFLLLGVGTGALISTIALGVVLTFRGSGVVNFANGAMAMFAGYIYDGLRTDGKLFVPPLPNPLVLIEGVAHRAGNHGVAVPHWPTSISFGGPVGFVPALLISLLVSGVLGLLFHLLIFRPLRHAPPLAKVVASVGLLIVLQSIVVLRFTGTPRPVKPILPQAPQHLPGGLIIPRDQLLVALLVVALTFGLWGLFKLTRFGLATRAAAENEKGSVLLGFSPDLLAGANWVLATVLAGLLGILAAPINRSIDPTTITILIVPALGAALLGSFTSFGVTTAAGLGIGMAQSLIQYLGTKHWFPHAGQTPLPGLKEAVPLLVIVATLFLRGRSLPTRGTLGGGRLPFAPRPTKVAAKAIVPAVLCALGLLVLAPDWRLAITNTLVAVLICLSLVVLTGFVGQISLAQMALAGVAGFTLSKLATQWHVPFPVGPLAGALVAVAFGLLTAIPALRVRGVHLAVVTLSSAVAIESFVFKNPSWSGGLNGANVPPPRLAGLRFGPNDPGALKAIGYHGDGKLPNPWFGIFCLIVVVLLSVMVTNLRRSATGRRMLAVRSNERAAAAAGVSVAGTKLLAFGLAAFIAGLGGGLSGYRFGSVTPLYFGSLASLAFLAFAYLGGISSVGGAVAGGTLVAGGVWFTALKHWFHVGDQFTLLLGGLGLILTAILNPEGIAGALSLAKQRLVAVVRARRNRMARDTAGSPSPIAADDHQLESFAAAVTVGADR